ncbi:helix-turn-helix transcriptional regulator, partial [Bradyrhizobium sp.]|uniref:helix-turn-helix transcriptional regulator n=1 Tax=Bradyrhizobium sp. TaxID=376 RepID=UPI003918A6DB
GVAEWHVDAGASAGDLEAGDEVGPLVGRDAVGATGPQPHHRRAAIGEMLGTGGETEARSHRVALIGLRGAGKSTLGRLLAEQLGWRFVELNREIERDAGFSVSEVFSLYGQDAYRRFEQAALARIVAEPGPMVLAVGGGIVSDPVTFERLLAEYFCIWIKASPTEHMERVRAQGDVRPMADDSSAMSELVTILKSREALYARARASLDTSGARVEDSVQALLRMVRNYCAAGCPYVARNRIAAAGANGPVCEAAAER